MPSIFARGRKLYARVKDATGKWQQLATGYDVGEEAKARRWAADRDREARDARARASTDSIALTLRVYAENWLARRTTDTVNDDATRLRLHVYPRIGDMLLVDVRPRHARDLVMAIRAEGKLAPRTIRQISGLLHTLFKSAFIEELVPANPIVFERGVLPKKVDKDPTWRHEAIYTRVELEQLISDPRILPDRRVFCALKTLAALRHTEAAELQWSQYDTGTVPLGALNLGEVKSGVPRRIPVHPTLARILDAWRAGGWSEVYGRVPGTADLIAPTRRFAARDANESQRQLLADLDLIGLRTTAGAARNRRGHDLRRSLITVARADGAIDSWLRWVTHGPKANEMLDVYSSPPWETLCAEVAKIRIFLAPSDTSWCSHSTVPNSAATDESYERPQRDSNPSRVMNGDNRAKSFRDVEVGREVPSSTENQETAPNRGEAADGHHLHLVR